MNDWNKPLPWLNFTEHSMANEIKFEGDSLRIMFAPRLEGNGVHSLPSGRAAEVVHLDSLPGAPSEWTRGRHSYVVPVEVGIGIWFDWRNKVWGTINPNLTCLLSIKGINPVTGQKIESLRLEEYVENCPVHNAPFAGPYRLCEKCGYEWPPQNHVCPDNPAWWDGFRQPDGKVRQFFFSDEDARDIASIVIGRENTVPAFGFAFYKPKNPRALLKAALRGDVTLGSFGLIGPIGLIGPTGPTGPTGPVGISYSTTVCGSELEIGASLVFNDAGITSAENFVNASSDKVFPQNKTKSVSVGAGAQITQQLTQCSLGVEGWQAEPSAVIRLYFCFEQQFREIVERGGVVDLKGNSEGYLAGMPTG